MHSKNRLKSTLMFMGYVAAACCLGASPADTASSAQTPTRTLTDVAYGADKSQMLDVYSPPQAHKLPVIVMVHGGGWKRGDKQNPGVVDAKSAYWLPKGYIFISINYRMLPQADPLTQAGDVASAVAFVQKNAQSWGGDPEKIILMGHSAGAHLAALISADPAIAAAHGAKPWRGSVILDSAAVDVVALMQRKHMGLYDDAFGTQKSYWEKASPLHQLTSAALPMMLVCSTTRIDKPCVQAKKFAAAAKDITRIVVNEQALSHKDINHTLGQAGAYTESVDRFIASLL